MDVLFVPVKPYTKLPFRNKFAPPFSTNVSSMALTQSTTISPEYRIHWVTSNSALFVSDTINLTWLAFCHVLSVGVTYPIRNLTSVPVMFLPSTASYPVTFVISWSFVPSIVYNCALTFALRTAVLNLTLNWSVNLVPDGIPKSRSVLLLTVLYPIIVALRDPSNAYAPEYRVLSVP